MDRQHAFAQESIIVAGGGTGLGRQYCLDLATEGARVLVAGRGDNVHMVVEEIVAAGGIAVACVADVREGDRIAAAALQAFGRIDGLIVNAGVLNDSGFLKMTRAQWDEVIDVHLNGTFSCVHAAWPHMREQKLGRIVLTATSGACYGNFGQANYTAAKGGILGLMATLALEGARHNVFTNVIAPIAHTRLTVGLFDDALAEAVPLDGVSPFVMALAHPRSAENGGFYEAGGGWAAKLRWQCAGGRRFAPEERTVQAVLDHWSDITTFDDRAALRERAVDSLSACAGFAVSL